LLHVSNEEVELDLRRERDRAINLTASSLLDVAVNWVLSTSLLEFSNTLDELDDTSLRGITSNLLLLKRKAVLGIDELLPNLISLFLGHCLNGVLSFLVMKAVVFLVKFYDFVV